MSGETGSASIEVQQLRKVFRTSTGFWVRRYRFITAVDGISFCVRPAELFGIVGPNGAGKTTTIKILSTLLLPTDGQARVMGLDVVKDAKQIRSKIGFVFGGPRGIYTRLSALDNLYYFAELYGLEPTMAKQRVSKLLALVGLSGREHERVETYSTGMQQRLHLARAMLHDPDVLFLDEPTAGIDPVGAREIRRIIKGLTDLGKTIVLSTHYMFEAEELCERIAIINCGKIVALDTPAYLKQRISGETVINIQAQLSGMVMEHLQALGNLISVHTTQAEGHELVSIRTRESRDVMRVLAPLIERQLIQSIEVRSPTLEDVYVSIIEGQNGGSSPTSPAI